MPDTSFGNQSLVRILHVSDVHFGPPYNRPVVEALDAHIRDTRYDVVVVSGDLAQRSLSGELQRGAAFLRDAATASRIFVVPGNHDVAWWMSPFHLFGTQGLYARYRRYISADLEPVLDVPGARLVGVNTAHGLAHYTLSTRLRDLTIVGAVTKEQLVQTAARLAGTSPGSARVVVMHHNPVWGELSKRFGVVRHQRVLAAFANAGAELILCGHDHQESVRVVDVEGGALLVCTAGTLSSRSRGGLPCSFHAITIEAHAINVTTHFWLAPTGRFEPGETRCFARSSGA